MQLVLCHVAAGKRLPYITIVQILFYAYPLRSEDIFWRNQNFFTLLFLNDFNHTDPFDTNQVLNRLHYRNFNISGFHHQILSGSPMRFE